MAHDKNWYIDLSNRAQPYTRTSYPYTHERLERSRVIKELRAALWELLSENEKQADEIAGLKELLRREQKPRDKATEKQRKTR